jgi:hypothetical protein
VWANLRHVDGLVVNPVYSVMRAAGLLVRPNPKLRARRKPDTKKPRPTRPNEWWGIDMTKVMIEGFGSIHEALCRARLPASQYPALRGLPRLEAQPTVGLENHWH